MISESTIKNTTVELLRNVNMNLPSDVKKALKNAYKKEKGIAKTNLKIILENIKLAEKTKTPICQDTGILIFYVKNPVKNTEKAIINAVIEATKTVPLRPNAVHPLSRENTNNNVGKKIPYINYEFTDDDFTEITVLPKGAGSENMSAFTMLNPSDGMKSIKEFALNTVLKAGGKPCPPTIVGIGIGGTADLSMKLAKKALLRPLNKCHKEKKIAELEKQLYNAFNLTGIGPMGLGGKTTVLGVNIEYASCHTGSLPVAINFQCWAARKATVRIYNDEKVEYLWG
ncbi:MAG: fumarate hydratase [Thermoplasmatales archaeon]|nr:fumarate hydratase [Thermoplasmatales archaeon]